MTTQIESIHEYLERLEAYRGETVVFRGVDHPWKMLPTIVRSFCRCIRDREGQRDRSSFEECVTEWHNNGIPEPAIDFWHKSKYESTLFQSFKRQARGLLQRTLVNDWEWLAVAQHYGLPTRLLDWTKNPLAAAFFAVGAADRQPSNAHIYVLCSGRLEDGHRDMVDLDAPTTPSPLDWSKNDGIARFISPVVDPRVAAQQSVFTVSHPLQSLSAAAPRRIDVLEIGSESSARIRRELHRIGVNHGTLFPDVSSLAVNLKWAWEEYRHRK